MASPGKRLAALRDRLAYLVNIESPNSYHLAESEALRWAISCLEPMVEARRQEASDPEHSRTQNEWIRISRLMLWTLARLDREAAERVLGEVAVPSVLAVLIRHSPELVVCPPADDTRPNSITVMVG